MQVTINLDDEQTRRLFKQTLSEMIEARDEALEDLVLEQAIQEGQESELAGREEIFRVLDGHF